MTDIIWGGSTKRVTGTIVDVTIWNSKPNCNPLARGLVRLVGGTEYAFVARGADVYDLCKGAIVSFVKGLTGNHSSFHDRPEVALKDRRVVASQKTTKPDRGELMRFLTVYDCPINDRKAVADIWMSGSDIVADVTVDEANIHTYSNGLISGEGQNWHMGGWVDRVWDALYSKDELPPDYMRVDTPSPYAIWMLQRAGWGKVGGKPTKALQLLKHSSWERIEADPLSVYHLIGAGVSWNRVWTLARMLGKDDDPRVPNFKTYGIVHQLCYGRDEGDTKVGGGTEVSGSTKVPYDLLIQNGPILKLPKTTIDSVLAADPIHPPFFFFKQVTALDALKYKVIGLVHRADGFVTTTRLWAAEQTIADHIHARLDRPATTISTQQLQVQPDADQQAAIDGVADNNFALVLGPPGTGKTEMGLALANPDTLFAAPTGKAADRLTDAVGERAFTVHSLIARIKIGKLRVPKLLVIDEVSMLDVALFATLLKVIGTEPRIVLIGDYDQLQSVQPGALLRDLADRSDVVPVFPLTINHRQSTEDGAGIVDAFTRIVGGQVPVANENVHLTVLEEPTPANYFTAIGAAIAHLQLNDIPPDETQVICARARKAQGRLGGDGTSVDELTGALRPLFLPGQLPRGPKGQNKWVPGDRVIQTSNTPDGLFNGQMGEIVRDGQHLGVQWDGVSADPQEITSDVKLAWALSGHKYQGSEVGGTVIVLPPASKNLLTREWLYTATSRARKHCHIICAPGGLETAVGNVRKTKRTTNLSSLV